MQAKRSVTQRALRSSSLNGTQSSLFQVITVPLNNILRVGTAHELHQGLGRRVVLSFGQEQRVLTDGVMERGRNVPTASLAFQCGIHDLRHGEKSDFGVSRFDETACLA